MRDGGGACGGRRDCIFLLFSKCLLFVNSGARQCLIDFKIVFVRQVFRMTKGSRVSREKVHGKCPLPCNNLSCGLCRAFSLPCISRQAMFPVVSIAI
jgi:hypothetical protein